MKALKIKVLKFKFILQNQFFLLNEYNILYKIYFKIKPLITYK